MSITEKNLSLELIVQRNSSNGRKVNLSHPYSSKYLTLPITDHSIALLEFISVPEVFISENSGHAGTLGRPSNELLVEAFKSSKFEDVFAFLAEHGHLQASGHHANLRGKETGSH